MKNCQRVFVSLLQSVAALQLFADASITNVVAMPVSPWGKVDISYEVVGTLPEDADCYVVSVVAKDQDTGKGYNVGVTDGDKTFSLGEHRLRCDMGSRVPNVSRVKFVVSYNWPYCVVDLSGGTSAVSYPVTGLGSVPTGGWTDEYKTTKLVLRRIEAGTYMMQNSGSTAITKPFYIGVFEVTQRQWELVMGTRPSYFSNSSYYQSRPVEQVSYNMIRGSSAGAGWPASSAVDASSFLGVLRAKTGLDFDLPTEAQWEYACRAGTMTTYSYGNNADGNYMWYSNNSGGQTHEVGTKLPNAWGLYDMHGNVWEWCLDWYGSLAYGEDPKGSSSGLSRVLRGGSWGNNADDCTSSVRGGNYPSIEYYYYGYGFRLVRTLSNNEQ